MRPPIPSASPADLFPVLLFGLALTGALYPGTNAEPGAPLWVALSCAVVGVCIWRGSRSMGIPAWASAIAAAMAAGLLPLATEGTPNPVLSAAALAATAAASGLASSKRVVIVYSAGILMAAASALAPAGLLAPLAYAWGTRRRPLPALAFLASAILGVALGWWLPAIAPRLLAPSSLPRGLAGYAVTRDLQLLLPLAMLGLGGVLTRKPAAEPGKPLASAGEERWYRSWASAGAFALLTTLFFGGLDLRLCLLPLLYWSPAGLSELRQVLRSGSLSARAVTLAAAATLIILAMPAVSLWTRALLVAVIR